VRSPSGVDDPRRARRLDERYGVELSVAEFVNRSVCSECGARWPKISISLEPVSTRGAKTGYTVVRK
jgi:hypothetical protein